MGNALRIIEGNKQPIYDEIERFKLFSSSAITHHSLTPKGSVNRDNWVKSIIGSSSIVRAEHSIQLSPDAINSIPIKIVSAYNAKQIKYESEMPGEGVMIACVNYSEPTTRAKLLRQGFDDIFDINKMPKDEAIFRIFSLVSRMTVYRQIYNERKIATEFLDSICDLSRLTDRERSIIELLLQNPKNPVGYTTLSLASTGYINCISVKHLAVIISNLRKKLKPNFKIENVLSVGYRSSLNI